MGELEIKNAKIESTMLGFEDHGIFSSMIHLDYGGMSQGFGGWTLGGYDKKTGKQYGFGAEYIKQLLETVGVEKWEDLPGKHIRVKTTHSKVHEIGHIIEDKWFNPTELAKKLEVK